jgi:nitrous oxide reductase
LIDLWYQEKEKLQTTLHALKEEIEAIKQKEHVLETEKLLIEMMDVQRAQADLELTKILFKEIKDQKTEELKKWEDKRNMFLFVTLNMGLDIIAIASSRSFFDANLFCALFRLTVRLLILFRITSFFRLLKK